MIRIRRSLITIPASVDDGGSAEAEREKARIHFTTASTLDEPFTKFKAYKGADVKAALESLFGQKCAYCEGAMRHVAPADIEHFRPKSGVRFDRSDTSLTKPGYYWLAATWDNLLPSCIDCNRGRTQLTTADPDDGKVRGKENYFPTKNPPAARLDHRTWDQTADNSDRLLLHPCRDRPESHLEFHYNGTVSGTTPKGRETITVLGLDRLALNRARRELVLELARKIRTIRVLMDVLDTTPEARLANELEHLLLDLEQRTFDQQPFAAVARTVVARFHKAIRDNQIDQFVTRLFSEATRDIPAGP